MEGDHVRDDRSDAREVGEPRQAPHRGREAAGFEDRATYDKNADDPAQHQRYREYRALMEDDPEWHDGEIEQS